MFESNYPMDGSCDYDVLWNAFKVFAKGYSPDEKTALFSGTAAKGLSPELAGLTTRPCPVAKV